MLKILEELGFKVLDIEKRESKPRVELYIKGDCNDADYEETVEEFSLDKSDDIDRLKEVIALLKTGNNYNIIMTPHFFMEHFDMADDFGLTEDEMEELYETIIENLDIPSDQFNICHTIHNLDFTYIDEKGTRYPLSLGLDSEKHRGAVGILGRDYGKDCEDDGYADEDCGE